MSAAIASTITSADIDGFNFSQLVGFVNEPNTCSGAARTIETVLRESPNLDAQRQILEVGSNTGYSVLHFASCTNARVLGVDVEAASVAHAKAKATMLGLKNAEFRVGDGTGVDMPNGSVDLLFASNVTSFIADREAAVSEYYRVLKPFGVLAAVPIFYYQDPPAELRARVAEAIGAPLDVNRRSDWESLFGRPGSRLFFSEEYEYDYLLPEQIAEYVDLVMAQSSNAGMAPDIREIAARRLTHFYELFNENLRYARYAILLYRVGDPSQFPILHTSVAVPNTIRRD